MTTPISDSQHTRSSHDEDSAIFLHSCLIERSGLGPRGGACVREFVGFQRRLQWWRVPSPRRRFQRRLQRRRIPSPRRRFQRRLQRRRVPAPRAAAAPAAAGSCTTVAAPTAAPAAAGSCTTAAAPAAVDRSADCCTTAAAPAADPTDIPRLPSLTRRNGWKLCSGHW